MKKCAVILISLLLSFAISTNVFAEIVEDFDELIGGIVFIGDSYCLGSNMENDGKRHPEKAWAQGVVDAIELENYAIACEGGVGLSREKNGKTFIDLLDDSLKDIADPSSVGWIFVIGGYNDYPESYDDIVKAGVAFVEHAHEIYPNAHIDFGMVGFDAKRSDRQKKLEEVVTPAWKEVAEQTGETYGGVPEVILKQEKNDDMSNDGFHPNPEGQYDIEQLPELFLKQQYQEAIQRRYEEQEAATVEKNEKHIKTTGHYSSIIVGVLVVLVGGAIVARIAFLKHKKSRS